MNKLVNLLLFEQEKKRGDYYGVYGARRKMNIDLGAGKKIQRISDDALVELKRSLQDKKVNEQYAKKMFNDILTTPNLDDNFVGITMWPKDDEALLGTRTLSDIKEAILKSRMSNDEIFISRDLGTIALTTAFVKILITDLKDFGLTGASPFVKRAKIKLPKDKLMIADDDEGEKEIQYDDDRDEFFVYTSEQYASGNVKLAFVDDIQGKDLRDFLSLKGYNVKGISSSEKEPEVKEEEDDDIDTADDVVVKEQREPDNGDEISKETPVFKTKKAMLIKRVDELNKSLDEFVGVIDKEDSSVELSDLIGVFTTLSDKLNEVGLLGKSE